MRRASKFLEMLASPAVADRYTAAKALSHLRDPAVSTALAQRMNDDREHIYVRLEAAAGLARAGDAAGWRSSSKPSRPIPGASLEAVIILGEIPTEEARQALTTVLLIKPSTRRFAPEPHGPWASCNSRPVWTR